MEIIQENTDGIEIFSVKGSLDSNTSSEFETRVYTALEGGHRKLIFNLENLDYISSAGIRVMLKTTKDLKRMDGSIVLCSLQDYVREVFDIAGFDGYLNIEKNLESAKVTLSP
jgi:anti-sigma B factor antagonist